MKEGWTNCKIGDICSITDFVSNGSFASLRENVKYYNSPNYAVLVRLADASNGFDKSRFVYTDEHGYNFSKKSHLHGGELIMSNVGSVGSMFICPVMKQPMTLAPNTISITSQNNRFLYYYFLSDGFKVKLNGITSSTTLKKFNKTNFKLLEITIPSLSEQQSIVDYLDSAFAKIDAMKANAEKALNEAKALFQASLKEMLEPKEGWEEKTLKETCSVITDGTHHSPVNTANGKYKYVTAKNIKPWGLDLRNITFVSEDVHKEIVSRCCPQKGDVLYIKDGATTGIAIVNPLDEEFCLLSSVALIRPNKNIMLSEYLCYALNSPSIYEQTRSQMDGAAITRVTLVKIKGFTIPLPALSEQQSIVDTLDSLKSKVDHLQENYDKISQECDALKQAILRQVFT